MDKKEVYGLLDNGWIYVNTNDLDYFKKVILDRLKKEDVSYNSGKIFIKKSPRLYKILVNIGMNISTYDAMVILAFHKDADKIEVNLYSLSNPDTLSTISERILKDSGF